MLAQFWQLLPFEAPVRWSALSLCHGIDPFMYLASRDMKTLSELHCSFAGLPVGHTEGSAVRYLADGKAGFRKPVISSAEEALCPKVLFATVAAGADQASEESLNRLQQAVRQNEPTAIFVDVVVNGNVKEKDVRKVLTDLVGELKVSLWFEYSFNSWRPRYMFVATRSPNEAEMLREMWDKGSGHLRHSDVGKLHVPKHLFKDASPELCYFMETWRREEAAAKKQLKDEGEEGSQKPKKRQRTVEDMAEVARSSGSLGSSLPVKARVDLEEVYSKLPKQNSKLLVYLAIMQEKDGCLCECRDSPAIPLMVDTCNEKFKNPVVLGRWPPHPKLRSEILCLLGSGKLRLITPEERLANLGYELKTLLLNLVSTRGKVNGLVYDAMPVPVAAVMLLMAAKICAKPV